MASYTSEQGNAYGAEALQQNINVNWPERYLSVALGTKLAFSGLGNFFSSPFTSLLKLGAAGYLMNRGMTGHCALYSRVGKDTQAPINVNIKSAFTVNKPRQAVYEFWRKLDNLPLFMNHLESVEVIDDTRSHWVLKLPTGVATVSWDAEIVNDRPGEVIGWSSTPNSMLDNAGKVYFQDTADGTGTIIDVFITYRPPAGGVGASVASILNPLFKNLVDTDVRNFKQYMDLENAIKPIAQADAPLSNTFVHN